MKILTVRTQQGKLHLAFPRGRRYHAVCRLEHSPALVVYEGRKSRLAWSLEVLCLDCERRSDAADTLEQLAHLAGIGAGR